MSEQRWRVKVSRTTPTWFHAVEVFFVDAPSAEAAKRDIEARSTPGVVLQAWAVTPATAEMEADYHAWKAACDEWAARVRRGESPRGLL